VQEREGKPSMSVLESASMKTGEIKEACFECLQFDPDFDTDPENPGHSARLCEAGQNHVF